MQSPAVEGQNFLNFAFFFVNTKGLLSVVKKLRRRLHIRFLFCVAQNLIGEPARITFLRRGLVWQKRSLTAASPRIHPKPLHKPLFCSCHFPEEKPRAQDPRNPDTTRSAINGPIINAARARLINKNDNSLTLLSTRAN